jgi:hypothetical protein
LGVSPNTFKKLVREGMAPALRRWNDAHAKLIAGAAANVRL